jgi:5-methylcytosine-specific restriction endonuclease McrA
MIQIPTDDKLDTRALAGLLKETQNSYKHLLFGFLLRELPRRDSRDLVFMANELQEGMLNIAKFPAIKCHLSLGLRDQAISILNGRQITSHVEMEILRWVPYRLLRPYFRDELKNRPEQTINQAIFQLAEQRFTGFKPPLYRLVVNNGQLVSIEVHQSWRDYLIAHFEVIDGWRRWHWANYLQRRNPTALNVMQKLEKPTRQTHELNKMRAIWRDILSSDAQSIRCTYTNELLDAGDIVVDHYLPWSYVGHDQSWNLCPTTRSINSKKSNKLPNTTNLKNLASIQHKTLCWMKALLSEKKWELFAEDYVSSLQISQNKLLENSELERALEHALAPHYLLAQNMGFEVDWHAA